jgi:hypothetical protein
MANRRWIGRAQAIKQVNTITVALAWTLGDTVTMTINDKALVLTTGLTGTTDVALALKEAWEGETLTDTTASYTPAGGGLDIVEHSLVTATVSGSVVTLTADTAGVPFTLTVSEVTASTGTATGAVATTATGPNFIDNVDNWDGGAIPTTGDDVYFDNSDVSALYGLGQSAVDISSLTIAANYTGEIGLPKTNPAGYVEYFGDYLEYDVDTITIGRGDGTGSGRIKIDSGVNTSVIKVYSTGNPAESGLEAFLWKGSDISNTMEVISGSVGVGAYGGEVADITTLDVTSGTVRLGAGFTAGATITNHLGTITLESNATAITSGGGTINVDGAATVGTLTIEGGVCNYNSSGTATTVVIGGEQVDALVDCSGDGTARTFTTTTIKQNGRILDPLQTITHTNAIARGADVREVTAI